MKVVLGNDHAAVEMKFLVKEYLEKKGYSVINIGTDQAERCNYPDIAIRAAHEVADGNADCGILICGTGIGMSIAANKVKGIRAASCADPVSARLAKEHNHANILCFGARIIGTEMAYAILDAYFGAEELSNRHQMRVDLISDYEQKEMSR